MAAPLPSTSRRRVAALLLLLAAGGCANHAPDLPPDTTGIGSVRRLTLADFDAADAALSCEQIAEQRRQIASDLGTANGNIEANRTHNQVTGFIGAAVLPLAYIATEGNYADKDRIRALYPRNDTLIKLASVKSCPPS
jgi:hypothetical protein